MGTHSRAEAMPAEPGAPWTDPAEPDHLVGSSFSWFCTNSIILVLPPIRPDYPG